MAGIGRVRMKGGGIARGAGAAAVPPAVTQFMLRNLTKSLSEGKEGRREAERERREGVVVCKERAGGVQWKYVSKEGKAGEKAMHVMHAKLHRDPVAVGYFYSLE
jgi:hypothetical protein